MRLTTLFPDEPRFAEKTIDKYLQAANNTAILQNVALSYGCHLIGVSERNDVLFPQTSHGKLNNITNYLFAEGKVDNWEVSWLIANKSKLGNKFGFTGAAPLIVGNLMSGIFRYKDGEWIKL